MKKETGNKVRLGAFVLGGLLLFLGGIYYIGSEQQLFNKTFRINAMFRDVNGLQVGNNVRFSGINIGIVETIAIVSDTTVRVELVIDEDVRQFIKRDAHAVVGSDGLVGNKVLSIIPGSPALQPIEDGNTINTVSQVSFDDILVKLRLTTDNAASITTDLSAIVHNIREGKGTVGKLFMDTVFADNLDKTIVNVKQGTKGFKQNMDAAQNSILLRGYFKKQKEKEKADESKKKKKAAKEDEKK